MKNPIEDLISKIKEENKNIKEAKAKIDETLDLCISYNNELVN